jgi:hypothetical protein
MRVCVYSAYNSQTLAEPSSFARLAMVSLRKITMNFMLMESIVWGQILRVILILTGIALAGCSVHKDNPDFVYPKLHQSVSSDRPQLLPTDQLARDNAQRVGVSISPQAALAARIARLRRKAARLSAYRF